MTSLSCFKAYDIRGEIGSEIDESIAYRIGNAVAEHFNASDVVIGFDARETSPNFSSAASRGVRDAGANVINIGLAGTEEMYWAVSEFGASAGIEVTASHNPINYNGMKIVKDRSQPLDVVSDYSVIKAIVGSKSPIRNRVSGVEFDFRSKAREAYLNRILSFVDLNLLKPLKIVINSGNGAAGPTLDAIATRLKKIDIPLEFIRVHHAPDPKFPNGIPNPLLPQNRDVTANAVKSAGADFGVAFDGDFDRCFFFDEIGKFVPGEYVVGLLASMFLDKEPGSRVVHDPRVIWNTLDILENKGGIPVQSRVGHSFIKQAMRSHQAVYGGEVSAHHYFRDFAYCDSGMIPWILMAGLLSMTDSSLGTMLSDRMSLFPSSGEINFQVLDAEEVMKKILTHYLDGAVNIDKTDGISMTFVDWRFNIRSSNTEPLLRLNVETNVSGSKYLQEKVDELTQFIEVYAL